MTPEAPIELFYSYAREDEKWHAELEKSLSELRRHQINTWSYQQIIAGQDRMQEIDSHLNAAQVILLLISYHYLASDHCYNEMKRALERHGAGTAHVIPILLSPCDWQNAPFAHLQPLPMNQEPITRWSHSEQALLEVVQGIRHAIKNLSLRPPMRVDTTIHKGETKKSSHILITSLGASPIAISAVYDLLTKKEELVIDKVIVLCPKSENATSAYKLLREAFLGVYELQCEILPFEDVDTWTNVCIFLKSLYKLLNTCQVNGDTVYLSLTGVGESTAAIMASIAPSFPCVKHLYHLIDPGGEHFLSIYELALMTNLQRREAMYPGSEQLILVDIPFEPGQQINQQIITRLLTATEDELKRMEYDQEIAGHFIKSAFDPPIVLPGAQIDSVLIVPLGKTLITATQFYTLLQHQEHRNIHQVVLVYPAQVIEIALEAKLIRKALRQEANVPCTLDHISGLEEIDSLDACRRYQAELEAVIDRARHVYPDHRIDLAFSQVEENIVAMTIFAAQKKQLPYVYSSLITDKQLGEDIHERTTIEALHNQDKEERNKRLFLRAYEEEGVYTKINLFKIPLFSA
jgi:hypothetical protein